MLNFNGNNKKAGVFIDLKEESYVKVVRDINSEGEIIPKLLVPNYLMKRKKNNIEYGYKTTFLDKELITLIMEFKLKDVYLHALIDIRTLEKIKTLKVLSYSNRIILSSIDRNGKIIFETEVSNGFQFLHMRMLKQYKKNHLN